ncbi:YetF domain-containing protein [Oscillibacter sp.]|uniref:DUF421 domain-containing protein n=1 Tax=Oscillibacter sp. TaxID=1945593 RepID=UPI00339B18C7
MKEAMADIGPTVLTSMLSLVALFALTKLMGCKQVSQLTLFDYIIGITIGSIAAELATELEEPLQPLTALIIYGLVAFGISELATKSVRARNFINGKPLVLLDAGQIYRQNLRKARLDLNEFLTQCRAAGYFDLSQVQTALMEHNGSVSFLPKEPYRPATPSDMDLKPKQSHVQIPFVIDGKLLPKNLTEAGKEETWVRRELMKQGYRDESKAFLALWDGETKLIVFPMETGKTPS